MVSFLSLLSDRPRRCCSNNDSWTQRKRDSEPPGEEHYCDDVHNHRDTQPAEVRQPDLGGVRLHLLHCADDHLAGVAGLLLYPAVPLRKCQRQKSGERCWKGCLCFQKIPLKRKVEMANAWWKRQTKPTIEKNGGVKMPVFGKSQGFCQCRWDSGKKYTVCVYIYNGGFLQCKTHEK